MNSCNSFGKTTLLILLLSFCALGIMAQQRDATPNVIKINPLSLMIGAGNLQFEHKFSKRFSAQMGIMVGAPKLRVFAEKLAQPIGYKVMGITPEIRYYLSFAKRAPPSGVYIGAYLRLQHVSERYNTHVYNPDAFQNVDVAVTISRNVFAGGFLIGYQFLIKEQFALDLFIGPRYGSASSHYILDCAACNGDEKLNAKVGLRFDGMDLRAGIGVGYAF